MSCGELSKRAMYIEGRSGNRKHEDERNVYSICFVVESRMGQNELYNVSPFPWFPVHGFLALLLQSKQNGSTGRG
jgi:hypothetical protein